MKKTICISLLVGLVGCGNNVSKPTQLHSVYVVEALGDTCSSSRTFAGIVREDASVSLGFKTAGEIKRIFVGEGSRVSAGQLLAELDDSDYRLGVEALQIQYNQVKQEVERARTLMENKSISLNDFEKADAGLKQLGVQLQVNKNKLAYTRLYAPAAGVIQTVNFSKGEMVDAGTAVFTMINSGRLEVVCDIPVLTYQQRNSFAGFDCRATAGNTTTTYPLNLLSIVPKADSNQLYRMKLAFASEQPADITPGMNVEVTVRLANGARGVSIPLSAVFSHEGETCVWVVGSDSTVVLTAVKIASEPTGSTIEVESGLAAGSRIVRAGVSALQQGEKVRIIEQPSETNVGNLL